MGAQCLCAEFALSYLIAEAADEETEDASKGLQLPAKWVFNIMDEFVWYYETFHKRRNELARHRNKQDNDDDAGSVVSELEGGDGAEAAAAILNEDVHDMDDDELADVWSTHEVLMYLYQIVEKTQIREKLRGEVRPAATPAAGQQVEEQQEQAAQEEGEGKRAAPTSIAKLSTAMGSSALIMQSFTDMSGFFCLICLTRLHAKLGDYGSAVAVAKDIDLAADALFARVQKCHISLYYYLGYALLMARRYSDAAAVLSRILLFFDRTAHLFSEAGSTSRFIQKQADKIMALVAVPLATCPGLNVVDEVVATRTRKKYGEKMDVVANLGDGSDPTKVSAAETALEELFDFAAPGFIDGAFTFDRPGNAKAVTARQRAMFKREALQRATGLEELRSFLRLYTTIDVSKVASFMKCSESKVHDQLVELKVKNWQPVQGIKGAAFDEVSETDASEASGGAAEGASAEEGSGIAYRSSDPMHFYVQGSLVVVRPRDETTDLGKFFTSSVRELASIRESAEKALEGDKAKQAAASASAARVARAAAPVAQQQGARRAGGAPAGGFGSRAGGSGGAKPAWGAARSGGSAGAWGGR